MKIFKNYKHKYIFILRFVIDSIHLLTEGVDTKQPVGGLSLCFSLPLSPLLPHLVLHF